MTVSISKKQLQNLYENQKLTTFQIADRIGCCQATVWKKLKEFQIKTRLPGIKRVKITKNELEDLYLKKKLSTWQIGEETKISRGTIHRKLKKFGIKVRDRSESHIIHPKKDFSENPIEKSYLIGFRIGDLGVRKVHKNSKTICVASGSTKKEQIELIRNLFEDYSKVWIKEAKNKKINIQVSLSESFDFLLNKEAPGWIFQKREIFFPFLGGFTDAEGSIRVYNNMAKYSLGNYDLKLLTKIYKKLNEHGIKCNKPTTDQRKGKKNNEGYVYSNNYSQLTIHSKTSLQKLFKEIKPHIKHPKKLKDLNIAIENIKQRSKR